MKSNLKNVLIVFSFSINVFLFLLVFYSHYKKENKNIEHENWWLRRQNDSLRSVDFTKELQLSRYQYMWELISKKHQKDAEEIEFSTE